MVRRFRGEFHQKVDTKGRVSIPASFRRVLENGDPNWSEGKAPEIVIVYGDHRRSYLECYTMDAAAEVDAMAKRKTPPDDTSRRRSRRDFLRQAGLVGALPIVAKLGGCDSDEGAAAATEARGRARRGARRR